MCHVDMSLWFEWWKFTADRKFHIKVKLFLAAMCNMIWSNTLCRRVSHCTVIDECRNDQYLTENLRYCQSYYFWILPCSYAVAFFELD